MAQPFLFTKYNRVRKHYTHRTPKATIFSNPPPLHARKRKAPENCFRSYIDQVADGFYHASKLVRNEPKTTKDTYFLIKTRATSVGSYRRNYSHRSVALFRTKRDGPTRANIEYLTCSFLELDGSTDNTIKSLEDVQTLARKNNLLEGLQTIETSKGNFHVMWIYTRPLPFTEKGESYWLAQQTRLIQLFQRAHFNVDIGASLNPTQNLRNPSQLNAYNFKRRCEVFIHSTYQKTSLRRLYKALNKTSVPNPRPIRASVKLRRYLRANETFTLTHKELAETLGTSHSTAERIVKRAITNGDMFAVGKVGNNKGTKRATEYLSKLYIEPQFSEPSHSISTNNSLRETNLLEDFQANGAENGRRNRTIFALGLYLKARLGKRACIEAIRGELAKGARACHVPRKEFEGILKNVMKDSYTNPLSISKLREWGLLQETMCNSKYHDILLH